MLRVWIQKGDYHKCSLLNNTTVPKICIHLQCSDLEIHLQLSIPSNVIFHTMSWRKEVKWVSFPKYRAALIAQSYWNFQIL